MMPIARMSGRIGSGIMMLVAALSASVAVANDYPRTDLSGLGAAGVAKEVCSAVYLSGRTPAEFLASSPKFWMLPADKDRIAGVRIDRHRRIVTLELTTGVKGRAVFTGETGCVALGPDGKTPSLPYRPLRATSLDLSRDWPIGDRLPTHAPPSGIDPTAISRAVDLAFADDAFTAAYVVVYKGQIIAERYARGATATTRLPGWSMTKTIQSSLVGLLEQDGRLALHARVPIAAWSTPGDPRRDTTLADLLRMSAPISCRNREIWFDYNGWRRDGYPDSLYDIHGPDDTYAYAIGRPPIGADEPRGVYTNCQPLVVGQVLKQLLAQSGTNWFAFARERLFTPLGLRSMVVEPDRVGNPVSSAYSYAVARDWARLGLLYQQEGVWQGKHLFSPEFMAFVRAPAPYWTNVKYAGQVWLNNENCTRFPCDSYQMNGIEGQRVVIIPSLDLVVARLGFGAGDPPRADTTIRRPALAALENSLAALTAAIPHGDDPDTAGVKATLSQFFAALDARDVSRFNTTLADGFTLFENGRVMTGGQLFDSIKASRRAFRWTITQPRVTVDHDLATIDYRNTGSFTTAKDRKVVEFAESATLRRVGGGWKLAFLHSTVIPQID